MVFQPVGLKPGSVGRDPTSNYVIPNAYLNVHAVGSHGQSYTIRPSDCRRNVRITVQNASVKNFDATAFGTVADNMFDLQITGAPVHTMIDCYLHFFVQNTTALLGRTITPMLPHAFFSRQEVMANGAFTDDTIYKEQAYQDYFRWLASDEERQARAMSVWMETKSRPQNDTFTPTVETMFDEAATGIAPQERREYFYPVINFFTIISPWLCTKLVDPTFRFYGAVNPILSTNNALDIATPMLRFQQMEIVYFGLLFESAIRQKINEIMLSDKHYTRCLVHDRMQQTIQSTAQNEYITDIQLTVLSGEYAGMTVYVDRNNCPVEASAYGCNRTWTATTGSPLELGNITFNDSSGYPQFYNDFVANVFRYAIEPSLLTYPSVCSVKPYYPFYFCTNPTKTLQTGMSSGGLAMDGSFILKIQVKPYTVGATTAVKVSILANRYAILSWLTDGSFIVTKL